MRVPSQWMISSRVTVAWNIVGYLVYAALAFVGGFAVWFSLFFAMATDGCHDSACDASYHVFPAMVTMNRPGMSGDSSSWKGWGHVRWFIEEVPAGAA
ncbi:integral membrane protein [Mycobacterium tuberculosis]|nr:integral membrane protein [Mycobacterium tuberculosis]